MRWNSSWNGRVTLAAASILSGAAKRVLISARSAPPENTLRRAADVQHAPVAARRQAIQDAVEGLEHLGIEGIHRRPVERHRGDALGNAEADHAVSPCLCGA